MASLNSDSVAYRKLCNDIYMLTCTLNGVQVGSGKGPQSPKRDSSTLRQIITLLTTGTSRTISESIHERSSNSEFAVTGRANPDTHVVEVILFGTAQDTRGDRQPEIMQIEELTADVPATEIFDKWRDRSLDSHFADVFAMINFLLAQPQDIKNQNRFLLYIVNHTHPKIASQMLKGERLWSEHPMRTLRRHLVSITIPERNLPFKLKTSNSIAVSRFQKRGLLPSSTLTKQNVYIVDKDNIGLWTSILCDTYEVLEGLLVETVTTINRETGTPEVSRVPRNNLTRPDVGGAVIELEIFHTLLESKLMDLILKDTALAMEIVQSYSSADDETEVTTDDLLAKDEDPHHHVVRYLKTIVAWTDAITSLLFPPCIPYPLRAYMVFLPTPQTTIRQCDIEAFKTGLQQRYPSIAQSPDIFYRPVSKLDVAAEGAVPHAEAGLMGVACACWNTSTNPGAATDFIPTLQVEGDDVRRILYDVFSVHEMAVGVHTSSCWCCWKLHHLLQASEGGENVSSSMLLYPHFLLNGTHDTIVPWCAPQYGIPASVLEQMKVELELELEKLARDSISVRDAFDHRRSARSSDEDD